MSIKNYFGNDYYIYQSDRYNEGKAKPPFHDDEKMMKVTLNLLKEMEVFIETGSFMGKTIYFVGKNFPKLDCYSCEINQNHYNIAYEQVKNLNNVKLDLKPSPYALYNIENSYDKDIFNKRTFFWLDAHWGTTPLYDEITYITTNFKEYCMFIDDFTIPWDIGFHSDGYDLGKIKSYIKNKDELKGYMPNYSSKDPCCEKNPCGYVVITNMKIETFNHLEEIELN